ncbi:hypothetical protein MIND_00167300 [Mycena indigotica]|uniref:Uncharacterized protein n=1 Tax=Mycena indigotica TaxID=2126181 RepID=A0A8H6TGV5_9AGAR|nr:uncharacterized protein MIND_00167300 [Mycena indigotica]KAF7316482.1 hypothetical protein MIND_00167300 [Mycena indigotica]
MSSKHNHQILEIEDDDARLQRIQNALERLNASTSRPINADMANILGSPRTLELGTGNNEHLQNLLARVQAFLPEMEASNALVAQRAEADPNSVDIENVDDDEAVIEMNLGLGVFEDKNGDYSTSESDESEEETTSDSESSDDNVVINRPIRPLPKRGRAPPEIIVLSGT